MKNIKIEGARYTVVSNGALPSVRKPRTIVNDVLNSQIRRRMNGRIVKTRKTRIG